MPRPPVRLSLLALAVTLSGGCVYVGPPIHEDRQSIRAEHRVGSGLDVDADNGWVKVSRAGGQDTVSITAHIKARGADRAEQVRVHTFETDDGFLRVECDWPGTGRKNKESCSFEIVVPDADGVRVRTDNGSVRIVGLRGLAQVVTDKGSVTILEHDGPAEVESDNGSVEIESFGWPAVVDTDNGRVELRGVGTPLEVYTDNGSIYAELDPFAEGPFDIETDNGTIVIEVGPDLGGVIDARTDNGSISIDHGVGYREYDSKGRHSKRVFIRLDGRAIENRLETDNGSIRVRPLHE